MVTSTKQKEKKIIIITKKRKNGKVVHTHTKHLTRWKERETTLRIKKRETKPEIAQEKKCFFLFEGEKIYKEKKFHMEEQNRVFNG